MRPLEPFGHSFWWILNLQAMDIQTGQYRCAFLRFVPDLVDAPGNLVQAARKLAVGCDRLLGLDI